MRDGSCRSSAAAYSERVGDLGALGSWVHSPRIPKVSMRVSKVSYSMLRPVEGPGKRYDKAEVEVEVGMAPHTLRDDYAVTQAIAEAKRWCEEALKPKKACRCDCGGCCGGCR